MRRCQNIVNRCVNLASTIEDSRSEHTPHPIQASIRPRPPPQFHYSLLLDTCWNRTSLEPICGPMSIYVPVSRSMLVHLFSIIYSYLRVLNRPWVTNFVSLEQQMIATPGARDSPKVRD